MTTLIPSTQVRFPTTLPAISPWTPIGLPTYTQILDRSTNLCWDTQTAHIGALVSLAPCQTVSSTQVFYRSVVGSNGDVVLSVLQGPTMQQMDREDWSARRLCVELKNDKTLRLSECRNTYVYQRINFSSNNVGIGGTPRRACVNRQRNADFYTLRVPSVCATYATTLRPVTSMPNGGEHPTPQIQFTPQPLQINGVCIDGTFSTGMLNAVACVANKPSQLWFEFLGQLRNVENGYCISAPNADAMEQTTTVPVMLRRCGGYPPATTSLWMVRPDRSIVNGESGNCMRTRLISTGRFGVYLGTQYCTSADRLNAQPRTFTAAVSTFKTDLFTLSSCRANVTRKDLRDLTPTELTTFFQSLNNLRSTPSSMARNSLYDDLVALHHQTAWYIHGTPSFLPWHRYYIALLEKIIQLMTRNNAFALPYWDWSSDADDWFLPSTGVLNATMLGSTGLSPSYCVTDGFMKGRWVPDDGSPCLMRSYFNTRATGAENLDVNLYDEDYMLLSTMVDPNTGTEYADYDTFRMYLEGEAHNLFHMAVAGPVGESHMGDPRKSVNDPVFFMHHNNINRYWLYFQQSTNNADLALSYNGFENQPPLAYRPVAVSLSDIMPGFSVPVSHGMGHDTGIYTCVRYRPYSKSIAAVSVRETRVARRSIDEEFFHLGTAEHGEGGHLPLGSLKDDGKHAARVARSEFTPDIGLVRKDKQPKKKNMGNRRVGGGKKVYKTLGSKTKKRLERLDQVFRTGNGDRANVQDARKGRRVKASKVKKSFLEKMGKVMKMDVQKQREMEKKSEELMLKLRAEVDTVLKDEFETTYEEATFEEHAQAVKIAIANLADGSKKA
ncbi:hypothetical protein HDV05_000909 [Chytridiales sp. JEL 0842]|nr:hypothetical protein HDV05_000909 [Chytridiales sp. JEL 0842]